MNSKSSFWREREREKKERNEPDLKKRKNNFRSTAVKRGKELRSVFDSC